MKQRSPTFQLFRFLLDVKTFHPKGFFIIQYKNYKSNLDKTVNI